MVFPSKSLVAVGGEISGHFFENPAQGVVRRVYWSVHVAFAPLEYGDEVYECSMACEWLQLPVRDWRALDGTRVACACDEDGVESSFYAAMHHVGNSVELQLDRRDENRFHVEMSMDVDFAGLEGDDEDPNMQVAGASTVPFAGIVVRPETFGVTDAAAIESLAREHLDVDAYALVERDGAYVFVARAT